MAKKRHYVGTPGGDLEEAQAAVDAANALYIAALTADPRVEEDVRLARRALLIAIANFLQVVGNEPPPPE